MNHTLKIGWLYPDLMNTYGDRGNIIVLQKRCKWRNIDTEVIHLDLGFRTLDLKKCDLIFMGGAQDRQQQIVAKDLSKEKTNALRELIENNVPGLYICGAYQFLGKYYKEADGTIIKGLEVFDLYTENPGENYKRLIGNVVVEVRYPLCHPERSEGSKNSVQDRDSSPLAQNDITTLLGFENHGGRTYLGKNIEPFGKVIHGFGNNGVDKTEGAVYKNSFGTYLHGPILPKNPNFADFLISKALEVKYKKSIHLSPLNDFLEWKTHNFFIEKRLS